MGSAWAARCPGSSVAKRCGAAMRVSGNQKRWDPAPERGRRSPNRRHPGSAVAPSMSAFRFLDPVNTVSGSGRPSMGAVDVNFTVRST